MNSPAMQLASRCGLRHRRGVTLMELLVAAGLMSSLLFGLYHATSVYTSLRGKGELRAAHVRVTTSIVDHIVDDLRYTAQSPAVAGTAAPTADSRPASISEVRPSFGERQHAFSQLRRFEAPQPTKHGADVALPPTVRAAADDQSGSSDLVTGALFGDETSLTLWRVIAAEPVTTNQEADPAELANDGGSSVVGDQLTAGGDGWVDSQPTSTDRDASLLEPSVAQLDSLPPQSATLSHTWKRVTYRFVRRSLHEVEQSDEQDAPPLSNANQEELVDSVAAPTGTEESSLQAWSSPAEGFHREESALGAGEAGGSLHPSDPRHTGLASDRPVASRSADLQASAAPLSGSNALDSFGDPGAAPLSATTDPTLPHPATPDSALPHSARPHPQTRSSHVREIEAVSFAYFDGANWRSNWDSRQTRVLPVAVRIRLWIHGGSPLAPPRFEELPLDQDDDVSELGLAGASSGADLATDTPNGLPAQIAGADADFRLPNLLPDRPADLTRMVCLRLPENLRLPSPGLQTSRGDVLRTSTSTEPWQP